MKRPKESITNQPHLDQADQQASRFGQPLSPQRRLGAGAVRSYFAQRGDAIEHLDAFVAIRCRLSFRRRHNCNIVNRNTSMIRNTDQGSLRGALPAGRHFFRQDAAEAYSPRTVWHRRVPDRYPEVIVQAVSATTLSAPQPLRHGQYKVSVVSGGHSLAASHLRDGAVLLDEPDRPRLHRRR